MAGLVNVINLMQLNALTNPLQSSARHRGTTTLVPPYMASICGLMMSYFVPRLRSISERGNELS